MIIEIGKMYKLKEKAKLEINNEKITSKNNYIFEIIKIEPHIVHYTIKESKEEPLQLEKIIFSFMFEEYEDEGNN